MQTAKAPWRTWIKLLAIPAITTALLLILFTGLRGYAAVSPESTPADTFHNSTVSPSPPTPMQIASSATTSVCEVDAVLVLDRSGSMEFDTICYGCWEVDEGDGYDYTAWSPGNEYSMGDGERGGVAHPLSYPHDLCSGAPYWDTYSSQTYIVIEAEHYTQNWPTFDPGYRLKESSYWGLQRNGRGTTTVGGCSGEDGEVAGCGGYMQHNPFAYVTEDQVYTADPDDDYGYYTKAPQLIYDFRVPGPGRYYVWLRAQGGYNGGTWSPYPSYVRYVHWGVDGDWKGNPGDFEYGGDYRGARNDRWRWRQVGYFDLGSNWNDPITHTLNIWAGGTGFRLDKIVITGASNGQSVLCNDQVSSCGGNCSNCYSDKGPPATSGGRDGYACWPCNPLYGRPLEGSDCEGIWQANPQFGAMYVAMFDDQQPLRASKEAVKLFIEPPEEMENRLEPKFDQIGFVSYSSSSSIDSELECIKEDPLGCTDFQKVLGVVELPDADGNTNTGSGLWDGILVLYNGQEGTSAENPLFRVLDRQHYGRPGTSRFIILLTDGVPTANPGDCPDLWPDGGRDYDCAVYYAEKAREQGIILYTIGLGQAVDEPLLIHMADVANGAYFPAKNKEDLDEIFDHISESLFYGCSLTLSINKNVTPTVVVGSQPFTYTIAVSNTGALSATGVLVQDTLPAGTTFITASGSFSPAHPLAGDTVSWDIGTLPYDGTPVSVTLVLSTAPPLRTFTNTATVLCDWGISATATAVASQAQPSLNVAKNVTPAVVVGSQPFTYTIAVSNTGTASALSVHLYDTLPPGTFLVTASGVFSPAHPLGGETVVWEVGTLPNDGVPLTVTVVLTTTTTLETVQLTNTATVTCAQEISTSDSAMVTVIKQVLPRWFLYLPTIMKSYEAGT